IRYRLAASIVPQHKCQVANGGGGAVIRICLQIHVEPGQHFEMEGACRVMTDAEMMSLRGSNCDKSAVQPEAAKHVQPYDTLINDPLKSYLGLTEKPLTADMVRKIVRQELSALN
ncbi:MAG TPA: hypothetical protein VGA09_05140, partial [Candidatus Binatia bacterium]